METTNIIIILLLILFILTIIGHITVIHSQPAQPEKTTSTIIVKPTHKVVHPIGGCSGTQYGCCPNGVTAKSNNLGTNCY
jgi:hypothetical protein